MQCDEDEEPPVIPEDDPVDATGKAVYDQPFSDMLLNVEVLLPQGEEIKAAKYICRSKDNTAVPKLLVLWKDGTEQWIPLKVF